MVGGCLTMNSRKLLFEGPVALLYLFIVAPLICVIAVSFNGEPVIAFPPTSFSLKWYVNAITNDQFVSSSLISLYLALSATLIGVPLGTLAAIGLSRSGSRFKPIAQSVFLAPLAVPGIVISLSILLALSAIDFKYAPTRLLLGHVIMVTPYAIRTVLASLSRMDESLEEVALTLGANPAKTFFLVTLPLIRPGIIAGAIFSFILSFDDVTVSLFLIDARTATLPITMMSYLEYSLDPTVAAISSLVIIVTLLLALLLQRMFGLRRLLGAQ